MSGAAAYQPSYDPADEDATHGAETGVGAATAPVLDLPQPASGNSALDNAFDAADAAQKQEILTQVGKDMARTVGANVVAQMLNATGLSGREIQKRYGFDHTALSRLARGESVSGPTLWKIFALASALGFTITLAAHRDDE